MKRDSVFPPYLSLFCNTIAGNFDVVGMVWVDGSLTMATLLRLVF